MAQKNKMYQALLSILQRDQFIDGFLRFDDIKMDMEYHQTFP